MRTLDLSREILSKEIIVDQTAAKIFALFSFIILTALGAYVRIPLPFTPVPITLQTFFVLLCAAALGRNWAAASLGGYLLLGLSGLPVFSGANSGPGYLFGPTGGYIMGFIVTAWIVGWMLKGRARNSITRIAFTMIAGSLAGIYLFGVLGLTFFLRCSLSQALSLGFLPFIPGDAVKIIAASFLFRKIEKRCREVFGPR
ncbi:MAG: biotin transporter BioY [Candidatus Omnitrophica bacterium]|nr:biotin transporter BioY [Candidatus Omnitrophota bacterium]